MKCENRTCGSNVNGWCQFEAEGDERPSFCRLHELVSLTDKQDEYINLLVEELNECVPVAMLNGWRTPRFDEGGRLRSEIEALKKKANATDDLQERR